MTTIDLPEGVEHGTPEGHEAGCKGEKHCPALHTHGMTCTYAYVRSTTTPDRYFKAKSRDPRPEAIARTLGFKPIRRGETIDVLQEDEKFAERSAAMRERAQHRPSANSAINDEPATPAVDQTPTEVLDERPDEPVDLGEAAAPPLAERSNDPSGSDEAPVVDEASAVQAPGEGVAEDEGMGHPTPAAEKPAPTADDEKRRRAEIRAWAAEHGVTVSKAGRIPHAIVVAWLNEDPSMLPTTATSNVPTSADAEPTPPRLSDFTAGLNDRQAKALGREIRAWCRTNGFPHVPDKGKIPADALAAYAAAQSTIVVDEQELAETAALISAEALVEHGLAEGPVEELAAGLLHSERSDMLDETRARIDEPPRPEWGDVAAAADVEHAREIAARLFLNLTDAEAERDRALAALDLALRKWDEANTALASKERRLSMIHGMLAFQRARAITEESRAKDLSDKLAALEEKHRGLQETARKVATALLESDKRAFAARVERDRLRALIEDAAVGTARRRRWLRKAAS
ncbi:hypothetical protein LJR045_000957 [Microbacterium sp. LjRoot45]|uniref:Lsr2 family DNA-binding protein n=1 Tax=Microbacterium sp. LjRoot45 TaxID=3342329 RepID=UPI003ECC1FB0